MTLQDIMDEIYVAVDNDPTNSTNQDDEWTARLRLINMGIKAWEREDVLWNELWSTYTHGSAVTGAQTYVIAATDFRFPGSYVSFTLNGAVTYVEIIKPEEAFKYLNNNNGIQAVYITGNPSAGWTINLTWIPVSGDQFYGSTMSLNYYKSATRMATTTDKPEMSDPSYLVNFVAYRKNLYNGRSNVAQDYITQAQSCIDNMKIRNEMRVPYGHRGIEDTDFVVSSDSLGM
jgi:hypothetical protein